MKAFISAAVQASVDASVKMDAKLPSTYITSEDGTQILTDESGNILIPE